MNKTIVKFSSKVANLARKAANFSMIESNKQVTTCFSSHNEYEGLLIHIMIENQRTWYNRLWYKPHTDWVKVWLNLETINSMRNEAKYRSCKCDDKQVPKGQNQ